MDQKKDHKKTDGTKKRMRKIVIYALGTLVCMLLVGSIIYGLLANRPVPDTIQYGVSFNTPYARELGLDWKETFDAIIGDLGVRHFRLAAHWNMVEPADDQWNFTELDYQIAQAERYGAKVVFGVGRRLPRWPECHVPLWAYEQSWEQQKEELLQYIQVVVERYRDSEAIEYWQIENEPFLEMFAHSYCGDLDVDFLKQEIALVKKLDPAHPILITDSGDLGLWTEPYTLSDSFGISTYVYLWDKYLGPIKSFLPPSFYRAKTSLVELFHGTKETILIELSLEPWLLQPVVDTPRSIQLARMDIVKFKEIIEYARDTRMQKQYLWGAEWWYYMMKTQDYPDLWNEAKTLFIK
jgi:hypothetical protein